MENLPDEEEFVPLALHFSSLVTEGRGVILQIPVKIDSTGERLV